MENQRAVFERLFGDSDNTKAARLARSGRSQHPGLAHRRSSGFGGSGRPIPGRFHAAPHAIRDIERRIQKAEEQIDVELPSMDRGRAAHPVDVCRARN